MNNLSIFWHNFEFVLKPIFKNLNPSLFQGVVLGILAIFIPFAIVFLTDILNSKNERSELEKMVLSDEVLGVKGVFWTSVLSIIYFSFIDNARISFGAKISAIIILAIVVYFLSRTFKKILQFSEGKKTEFELSFLKKLRLSISSSFSNEVKLEKMLRAWNSFWSHKAEFNEIDFTKIFISHIDDAIKFGKLNTAMQLAQIYKNNIDKRDHFSLSYEILPKA